MTPAELTKARHSLGIKWGLNRPLHASELGRILGLRGRDPGATVLEWERGANPILGPEKLAIWYMLETDLKPFTLEEAIKF